MLTQLPDKADFINRKIANAPSHWPQAKKIAEAHKAYRELVQKIKKHSK